MRVKNIIEFALGAAAAYLLLSYLGKTANAGPPKPGEHADYNIAFGLANTDTPYEVDP